MGCDYIVYIGDFDFRNKNVQSFLVRNNGKILNEIGYKVAYIGVNTKSISFDQVKKSPPVVLENDNLYYELPNTLNIAGLTKCNKVCQKIVTILENLSVSDKVVSVITYQCPTYAVALSRIAKWCQKKRVSYIVNCADLPIFDQQPFLRRIVMKFNWACMHTINKKHEDGLIAVSRYIQKYYEKDSISSVVLPPLFDSENYLLPEIKENEVPTFIYAGTPFKSNGKPINPKGMKDRLDKVLDIFDLVSKIGVPYKLNVVGISFEDYVTGVPRHKDCLKKSASIEFFGRCTHEKTLEMVAKADFSINYRDNNLMTKAGFSTKIVESVSLGTPVVINDISDTYYYLQDGFSGYKLTDSIEDNVSLIHKLCTFSCSDRASLKKALVDEQIFAYSKYADRMKQFLESVLSRK